MDVKVTLINPDDRDNWPNSYIIYVGPIGGPYMVYADTEQDALDELIDWAEINAPGLVSHYSELEEMELEEFYCGGNHGLYLTEREITIELLRRKKS